MIRLAALIVTLGLALAPAFATAQDQAAKPVHLVIDVLDVGQGDSILIRSPEGKTALIDAGPSRVIVPLLRKKGVTSIDLVCVSHHHIDHYGGMDDVIRAFRPKLLLASNSSHTTPSYLKLLTLVRDTGMTAIAPTDSPRKIELGSVVLTVLPQPPEDSAEENNNSIGIRVQFGSSSMLLTGDSENRERAFWEANCPDLLRDCGVLKLAHHGSRDGTDARWLRIVQPKLAVVSLGATNEYGHPHRQTLSLLERRAIPLLRTDRDGTIEVVSDGKKWEVVGRRDTARGPPGKTEKVEPASQKGERRLIDINTASQKELEALPGIGPVIAQRIIEGRPYHTVDDLLGVTGIGQKRLADIRPLVRAK